MHMKKHPNHIYYKLPENRSFIINVHENDEINTNYHFHKEYELTLIESGFGRRFVGDHLVTFSSGDLVFIGSNVPHCWKFDEEVRHASMISLLFDLETLGGDFFQRPELRHIAHTLQSCKHGFELSGLLKSYITSNIQRLLIEKDPFSKMLQLVNILHLIAKSDEKRFLSSQDLSISIHDQNDQKMVSVFDYIQENFYRDISLEEVSAIAGLSVNAFCKFFKRNTEKTFIQIVNEFRIDYSRQLLLNSEMQIGEVAYKSGYSDISHFFRTFKKMTGFSPLKYRQTYKKNVDLNDLEYIAEGTTSI